MRGGHAIAGAVAVFFLVSGLCGAVCEVSYCSEDCDPCVQQCKCRHNCNHGFLDFETAHRLASYRLIVAADPQGGVVRTFSELVGLSLDFADGQREHAAGDFSRFARGVIEVNTDLIPTRSGPWTPDPVETFETAIVVPFHRDGTEDSLSFLFDRRGSLVEIDEVRPRSRQDPR